MTDKIMMDGEPLKVGYEVYSLAFGKGEIIRIHDESEYPIFVKFKGSNNTFNSSFKWSPIFSNRDLYWQKPEIIPPPKPKKKIKVWDWFIKSGTCIGHHTNESEDDMKRWYPNDLIQKIDGTEREVEV